MCFDQNVLKSMSKMLSFTILNVLLWTCGFTLRCVSSLYFWWNNQRLKKKKDWNYLNTDMKYEASVYVNGAIYVIWMLTLRLECYLLFLWVQMSGAFPEPVAPKISLLILINLSSPCIFIQLLLFSDFV